MIKNLNMCFVDGLETVACCCGHDKYSMTIVVKDVFGNVWEMFSSKMIHRKRRFYKKDEQGIYYIPEVEDGKKD